MKSLVGILCGVFTSLILGPTLSASAPVVMWKTRNLTTGAVSSGLPPAFPGSYQNYTVQASGYSDEGRLMNVIVWKDGQYFAYNAGNNGLWNNSDPNTINDPPGTFHVFKAKAVANDGKESPYIYWVTKAGGSSLSYADLQRSVMTGNNPNGTSNPWFPNTGDALQNSTHLNAVIQSLASNRTSGKVLEFSDDTYRFHAAQGYMAGFNGVAELTIQGGPQGKSVLNWAVRDANGVVIDPSTSPSSFTYTVPWNPQPVDPTNHQPHNLFAFDASCDHVVIKDLTFDTDYTARIGGEGSHIKLAGTNQRVTNCTFYHATGFAVFVGQTGFSQHISVDANRIYYSWADGIHVLNSDDVWLVGNSIFETGDDGIAVTSEGGTCPTRTYIWSNYIHNTHWRGILVWGATNVDMDSNFITGTAAEGVEVAAYGSAWNNCLQLQKNYVENLGTLTGHNYDAARTGSHGYRIDGVHNLHADFKPRSDAPLHNGVQYAAFRVNANPSAPSYLGAFITNVDNASTSGTPYPHHCENTSYFTTNTTDGGGGGFAAGAGAYGNIPVYSGSAP
ncbi:hypothetical protein DB347_07465 [Opitutaceae bacterium EW11]|nr:hypothetical protein DB347_07465 [Opitutaceae bacterium EW11]